MARTPTVLVVEDDPAIRMLMCVLIAEETGARTVEARDGAEALALARCARPDVVLLDMRLPEVPGKAVCRRLKGDPATAAVPVIGVSAAMTRGEGLDAGCDWFLPKPFDLADLVALVRTALRPLAGASPHPARTFAGGAGASRTALAWSLTWHRAERAASRKRLAAIRASTAALLNRVRTRPRAA